MYRPTLQPGDSLGQAQNQRLNAYSLFKLAWNSYKSVYIVMQ